MTRTSAVSSLSSMARSARSSWSGRTVTLISHASISDMPARAEDVVEAGLRDFMLHLPGMSGGDRPIVGGEVQAGTPALSLARGDRPARAAIGYGRDDAVTVDKQ